MAQETLSDFTNDPLKSSQDDINSSTDRKNKLKSGKSMFDRYAVIDYGRYVRSAKWEEYKQNADGDKVTFVPNNPIKHTDVVKDESTEELTIPNIVRWSEKYPALQLRYQDFFYCRRMDYYPNNRLVVLRRFKNGVPDNLFDYYNRGDKEATQPVSTMVTWLKQSDKMADTITFNEAWEGDSTNGIFELLKSMGDEIVPQAIKDWGISKIIGKSMSILDVFVVPNALDMDGQKREDGLKFMDNENGKDPNFIHAASKRKTGAAGLSSTLSFGLKFEYDMRYVEGIDPSIAMLDLLSNCLRMGTSVARFKYPIGSLKNSEMINQLISANLSIASAKFMDDIKGLMQSALKKIEDTKDKAVKIDTKDAIEFVATNAQYVLSRYREDLKSAFAADTGTPSGIWHVTIGNPKKPVISCGDLILNEKGCDVTLGTELGYNDFPTSFVCTVGLTSARPRGRDEIERIFNAGRGRIYVYPNPSENIDNFLPKK